jgi:hypothetical protein
MLTAANISRSEAGLATGRPQRAVDRAAHPAGGSPDSLVEGRASSFRSLSQRSILSAERERFNEINKRRRLKTVALSRGTERFYGAGGEDVATSSLQSNRWSAAMPQPNDLSRSLVALDHNSTIIAVVELSQSSWLVGGVLPGIER